jgi:predicted GH43/DUF377 family glycosyl hydrolase
LTTVIYEEGVYKMWGGVPGGIGYGTSVDGRVWEMHPGNPVLVPDRWYDAYEVANASVVIVDGIYHMWYSGQDMDQDNRISHATSENGIDWDKNPANPVMDLGPPDSLDSHEVMHPFVLYEEPLFRMWYNGHDGSTQRILQATSLDGVEWARSSIPALEPGDWDPFLGMMSVLRYDGSYYMFYTGGVVDEEQVDVAIGCATSDDGTAWTRPTPSGPVFTPGAPGAWDDSSVIQPVLMTTSAEFVMWYGGSDDGAAFSTGVATSALTVAAPDFTGTRLARIFPNPFNPQTTIFLTLKESEWVSLGIYDLAGKRTAVLVARELTAGTHSFVWRGRDTQGRAAPSGMYIVRLETDSGVETRKVMLAR